MFNLPFLMVVIFLLLTLATGIYYSYNKKSTTLRTYAVGDKTFSTTTLVATVLATTYGGGTLIRAVEQVYNSGLYWIMLMILAGLNLWIVSLIAIRMGPFMKHLSLPETIGSIYGPYARIITGLSAICSATAVISIQINVISVTISSIVPYNPYLITVLATLILIFYSTLGGIRSVTFTDVLQFITFTIIIPLVAWFMFLKTEKSFLEIIYFLQDQERFQVNKLFQFNTKLISLIFLSLSYLIGYTKEPTIMQRIYMASGPTQAYKVFKISTICHYLIKVLIILISLFVFVKEPHLPVNKVWNYVPTHVPPVLNGFIAISLLAMTMSTADSHLNNCAVIASHDILEKIIPKKLHPINHLKLVKWSSLIIGLLAMMLTFYCNNLLTLLKFSLDFSIPITVAPFLLAVFGFRGSSRTALIGMATGITTIIVWNRYIQPTAGIDGSFICMLANGTAIMLAHYLLPQPDDTGWIELDAECKQMQQEDARKKAERKERIKNFWTNRKNTLTKLPPNHAMLIYVGFYTVISNLLTYFIASITDHNYWLILQILVGACLLGYSTFISEKIQYIPGWVMSLFLIVGLAFCLPINVLWHWWHGTNLFLTLGLSLSHLAVTLLVLPLYLGVSFLIVTLLIAIYLSSVYCSKPLVLMLLPSTIAFLLLLYLVLGLLIFGIFVYFKRKVNNYFDQVTYLNGREKIKTARKLKEALYDAAMLPSIAVSVPKGNSSILGKVIGKIEESISFLDNNIPLYKQDFQSIINKFYDWATYFNKREKMKNHALLQPTKITLEKLIRKVACALSQEVAHPPRLFVEQIKESNSNPLSHIVCDITQVVYLLVQTILRICGKVDSSSAPIVRIQLHATSLQFKQADPIDNSYPSFMDFQATALVVSQSTVAFEALPEVKERYDELIDVIERQGQQGAPPSIDLRQETISSIVGAHYGYLESPVNAGEKAILLVLPSDVTAIRDKMITKLPIDCLTVETPVTTKEQADSMMALMQFHDHICKSSYEGDPIDIKTISGLLLLLRQHFGFKRHASGQLFYVRAVGIAALVVEWVFHSPKVIYASLLYELVRRTCLPLSYVKKHYNLGVYTFVLNVVGIDKRQNLDHPSLLYVQNRLKEAIKADHVQLSVLFIKLAERLYDLRHAEGYIHLTEVQHMAQETLAIDVKIANAYLSPEIGIALEKAAKQALEVKKDISKIKHKDS